MGFFDGGGEVDVVPSVSAIRGSTVSVSARDALSPRASTTVTVGSTVPAAPNVCEVSGPLVTSSIVPLPSKSQRYSVIASSRSLEPEASSVIGVPGVAAGRGRA